MPTNSVTSQKQFSLEFLDRHQAVLFVMLDLSVAFDTVDHTSYIHLKVSLVGTVTALSWFKSYLTDLTHSVSTFRVEYHRDLCSVPNSLASTVSLIET